MSKLTDWCRGWWVTLRHGSRWTREGRVLRRSLRDPFTDEFYAEVEPDAFGHAGTQDTPLGGAR